MPELPEVETIARSLQPQIIHHRIHAVEKLDWERMVKTPDPMLFRELVRGRMVEHVGRRAKWLLLMLDAGWTMALHLRMSGRVWVATDSNDEPDQHTHLVLRLDNDYRLFFRDPRKFGRVQLLDSHGLSELDQSLGVEPLGNTFDPETLGNILSQRRTVLKSLLLNQTLIAGLGNIYVDESLWHARLHPQQPAHTVTASETCRLHAAIRDVLQRAIAHGGSTLRDYRNGYNQIGQNQEYFSVYGRTGQPCLACGFAIERLIVAQRSTHVCPKCQVLR